MSDHVHWLLEVTIKPGERDTFIALMREMVTTTQANEPDTLNYEWFISEDETSCKIYERYRDSAAVMTHLASFGANFADRFLAASEPTRFVVFGDPNEEVREALGGFGAVFMAQIGGFTR